MGIAASFFGLLKKSNSEDKKTKTSFYRSIYPESVRYAFQYKGAQMGKAEMHSLIERYTHEVVYLVTKALAFDREGQRRFLEELTRLYMQVDWEMADLQTLLQRYIERLPDDITVAGTKLAQINRYGSAKWQAAFREIAENLFKNEPQALPCLVANTPIFAYHQFIEIYRQKPNAKLIFLVPGWMQDDDETQMGYEITLSDEPTVALQIKDQCLVRDVLCMGIDCPMKQKFCREAIFIDDTINTATTAGQLRSFWTSEYGVNVPLEKVRVITDLRNNPGAKKREARPQAL